MCAYKVRGQFKKDLNGSNELAQICKWFVYECGIKISLKNRVLEIYNSLSESEKLSFMNNLKNDLNSRPSGKTDYAIVGKYYFDHFGYVRRMSY